MGFNTKDLRTDISGTLADNCGVSKIEDEGTYGPYGLPPGKRGQKKTGQHGSKSIWGGKARQGEKEGYECAYVYFIQSLATKYIKIGYTNSLKGRLRDLQTGCSDKLYYKGTLLFPTAIKAKEVEKILHMMFDSCRVQGEWFTPEPDLLDFIRRHIKDTDELSRELKSGLRTTQERKLEADLELEHLYSDEKSKALGRKVLTDGFWKPTAL